MKWQSEILDMPFQGMIDEERYIT